MIEFPYPTPDGEALAGRRSADPSRGAGCDGRVGGSKGFEAQKTSLLGSG
jgi:hypothetical protein